MKTIIATVAFVLTLSAAPAHADKWQGWDAWCAAHPHRAASVAACQR